KDDLELGFPEEMVKGNPEKGLAGFWEDDNAVFESGQSKIIPNDLVQIDGLPHIFHTYKTPVRDVQGKITGVLAFARDVTELKESQKKLSEALNAANMAYWAFDVRTGMFTFNDDFYAVYGTTAAREGGYQMAAQAYAEKFVHPEDAGKVGEEIGKALQTNDPNYHAIAEARIIRMDGQVRDTIVRFNIEKDADGNTIRLFGANQDVTERKQIELEMESQRRTLQAVLDNMDAGVFMVEAPSGRPILSNKRAEEFLGRGISPEAIGDTLNEVYAAYKAGTDELYPSEDMPIVAGMFGFSKRIDDLEVRRPDGSRILLEVNGSPVYDKDKNLVASVVVFLDITDRSRVEKDLETQRRTLQAVLENMPAGVFMVEAPSGRPILSNKKAEEFLGRGIAPAAAGDNLNEVYAAYRYGTDQLYPAEQMPIVAGMYGQTKTIDDMEVHRPDGSRLLLEVTGSPVFDRDGKVAASVVLFSDITRRKEDEIIISARAKEMALAAELGAVISSLLEPAEVLQKVVDLTKTTFELYHTHIYLLNETGDTLTLASGAGDIGAQMVAEGRTISMSAEKSLVA
ncbi:PAS domain S-box protein, partial [bacterium]|nr:PAS domain S-box protein [bacterium]